MPPTKTASEHIAPVNLALRAVSWWNSTAGTRGSRTCSPLIFLFFIFQKVKKKSIVGAAAPVIH
jgi:hypothetical protein